MPGFGVGIADDLKENARVLYSPDRACPGRSTTASSTAHTQPSLLRTANHKRQERSLRNPKSQKKARLPHPFPNSQPPRSASTTPPVKAPPGSDVHGSGLRLDLEPSNSCQATTD